MKILVMGAGAVGSVFGGFLAEAGHTVTLIGRSRHMKPIAEEGLRITGIWGDHTVRNLLAFTSLPHKTDVDIYTPHGKIVPVGESLLQCCAERPGRRPRDQLRKAPRIRGHERTHGRDYRGGLRRR